MAKKPFFPDSVLQQVVWLLNFTAKIGMFAAKYGISSTQETDLKKDIAYLLYWFEVHSLTDPFGQQVTAFLKELEYGVKPGHTPSDEPVIPTLGLAPAKVAPGALVRILATANGIKANIGYTIADGEALQLEGAEIIFDPSAGKPDLKCKRSPGGLALLHATKGHYEGYEIWKDSGSGFVKFDKSNHADFIDHTPLPALGQTAIVKYKARYLYKGEAVGEWSDEVSIILYGSV